MLWTLQNIMGAVGLALSISFFRMLFSKHIWIQIHGIAKYFTPNQQNYLNTLRHDPEAISKLNRIMPQQSIHTISSIFKESFMSSFS